MLRKLLLRKTPAYRPVAAVIGMLDGSGPLAHLPPGGLGWRVGTDGPHPQGTAEVCGQFGVQSFDLGQGIAHPCADGLPRPLRLIAEPSVPAA